MSDNFSIDILDPKGGTLRMDPTTGRFYDVDTVLFYASLKLGHNVDIRLGYGRVADIVIEDTLRGEK